MVVQGHPVHKVCYDCLRAAGPAAQGALTACMPTLWTILHAIVKPHTPWQSAEEAIVSYTRRLLTIKTVAPLRCGFRAQLTAGVGQLDR